MTTGLRNSHWLRMSILAVTLLLGHGQCTADDASAAPPAWPAEVTLNGFLSGSYSYNFNRPASGTNQLRVFDFDDNSFKFDEFELVAQKAVSKSRDAGFRIDATFGSSVSRVTASTGLFRDASGASGDLDVHQAFASYIAPLGTGLRFDGGKFITSHGYEVIDGYDGWNDNATRSLLFGYAIPFTHVGVRASYAFSKRVSGTVMVVNGWDVARDNNQSKSLGALLTLTPADRLTILVSGMTGNERTGNDSDPRNLLDVMAILKVTGRLTLGANADLASERNASGPENNGQWSGVAGYARLSLGDPLALALRVEHFDDTDGLRTGVTQTIDEFTVTPECRLSPHLLVRADLRVDRSDRRVFQKGTDVVRTQPTVMVETLYSF